MELGFSSIDLEPGQTSPGRISTLTAVVAVVVPMVVAAALIPLRGDLAHTAGMILVLPVVTFGVAKGTSAGALAAVSAAIGFDLFLVAPYLHPGIDRSEDVVATITLLFVGLLAGFIGSRLARVDRRATERLRELAVLESHAEMVTRNSDEVFKVTSENLVELLRLRSCRWEPKETSDPTTTVGEPTMLDNGQIIGRLSDLPDDRGRLPNPVELVVSGESRPFGRFLLEPGTERASIEERRIAATLCRLTAGYLGEQTARESE